MDKYRREFDLSGQVDDDFGYGIGFGLTLGPKSRLRLDLGRTERDSDIAGADYEEFRASLVFSYSLFGSNQSPF